jgi:myosin-5
LGCARAGKGEQVLEVCKGLLAKFGVRPEQYQIGRTKLFFRAGVLGQLEDNVTRINRCGPLLTWGH